MTSERFTPAQKRRIEAERKAMNLRPWEFAPSEVNDGPSPWPESSAGFNSWRMARRWRDEIRAANPKWHPGGETPAKTLEPLENGAR